MRRFAAWSERKTSEVPSGAYNGICSRLEDMGGVGTRREGVFGESRLSGEAASLLLMSIRNGIHSSTENASFGSQTPQHLQAMPSLGCHARWDYGCCRQQ